MELGVGGDRHGANKAVYFGFGEGATRSGGARVGISGNWTLGAFDGGGGRLIVDCSNGDSSGTNLVATDAGARDGSDGGVGRTEGIGFVNGSVWGDGDGGGKGFSNVGARFCKTDSNAFNIVWLAKKPTW